MEKMNLKNRLKKSLNTLLNTIKRFPYATSFTILAAITMIVYNHTFQSGCGNDVFLLWLERTAVTALLTIPMALSIKMLVEVMDKKSGILQIALWFGVIGFFVLYTIFGFPRITSIMSDNFTYVTMIRYFCITVFLWGAFFAIPFILGRQQVEVFTSSVLWRLVVTGFYFGISFLAVYGIGELIEALFDVVIPNKYYDDIPYVLGAVFIPAFFFVGIPKKKEILPITHSKFFRILLLYVLMPIIVAYTVVIYAYFFFMIMQDEIPNNIIGNLVLWYSFIGILVLYFSKTEISNSKWAKLFDTWFPRLLFLPLGMMFYAMYLRINQYGITEPRYYMLVGGCWALTMAVFITFTRYNKRKNVIIPLAISLFALVTILGPVSSYSVSKSSQNKRLDTIFFENGIVKDGVIYNVPNLEEEVEHEISSIVLYFYNKHSLQDIPVFSSMDSINDVEESLGFELSEWNYRKENGFVYHEFRVDDSDYQFEVGEYDLLLLQNGRENVITTPKGVLIIEEENVPEKVTNGEQVSHNDMVFTYNGHEIFRKDLLSYYQDIYDKFGVEDEREQILPNEDLAFIHDFSDFTIKIYVTNIMFNKEDGEYVDGYMQYHILVKMK